MTRILTNIVSLVIGIITLLLAVRLLLRLFGANPEAGFTEFIYNTSSFFLAPFQGIFPTPAVEGAAFELSTFFAIVIYTVIGWLLVALIDALTNRNEVIVEERRIKR